MENLIGKKVKIINKESKYYNKIGKIESYSIDNEEEKFDVQITTGTFSHLFDPVIKVKMNELELLIKQN
jgi:hypothetical protein